MKITTATDEQWQQIDSLREQWIANTTAQHADADIVAVVHEMYRAMGEEAPIVLIAPSPLSMAVWASVVSGMAKGQLHSQLDSQLYSQLHSQLHSQLCSQLRSQLDSQLYSQLHSQLYSQLYSQLHSQLHSQLDSQLDSQLYSQLASQFGSQLHSQLYSQLYSQLASQFGSQPRYIGTWWRVWSGWYAGAKILGVKFDEAALSLFTNFLEHAACCVPYKGLCVVSRNPISVSWEDRNLHNDSGMSVEYADGWGLYSIGGVAVDEQIVMRPHTQTIDQIRSEENEEVKRIRIERYGWEEYISNVGATVVNTRRNDVDGTHEGLFSLPDGMKAFVGRCRSTGRVYFLEVDPSIESCEQAQAWMMGRPGNVIGAS